MRRKALEAYVSWPPGAVERAESLEQLRILEHGQAIRLFKTRAGVISVDSREAIGSVEHSLS
jgi:3-deoxy-manno-octulosonate cytidylyltransferase (CMP-KDO synthetase)